MTGEKPTPTRAAVVDEGDRNAGDLAFELTLQIDGPLLVCRALVRVSNRPEHPRHALSP
jgi:hypothetical protein